MGEAFVLEGSADTAVFELYVEQILAPSLPAGHIVILDNLHTHTGDKVRQAIEARGCQAFDPLSQNIPLEVEAN
jgi:transposase